MEVLFRFLFYVIINYEFVTSAYVTGGCDLNPYLKHAPHYTFEIVVARHSELLISIADAVFSVSDTEILTSMFVSIAFLECYNCASSSLQTMIKRSPSLPIQNC